jgi:hypothetical protein
VLIEVEYANGSSSFVMPETLDYLLEQKKIVGFRRATGWIAVGFDPVRANVRKPFSGAEQRRQEAVYRVEYI